MRRHSVWLLVWAQGTAMNLSRAVNVINKLGSAWAVAAPDAAQGAQVPLAK